MRLPITILSLWLFLPMLAAEKLALDTTSGTYVLFLDMKEVEDVNNTELVVNAAAKHRNNPIIPLGDVHEWDSLQSTFWSGSMIYDRDERLFKAWYKGVDHERQLSHVMTGYAISKDGIVWEKPRLGLFEYRGNKDNNITLQTNDARVIKDYDEKDPTRRYKMLAKRPGSIGNNGPTYYPYYSADGIRWRGGPDHIVYPGPGVEINQMLIDPLERDPQRRIKVYGQGRFPSRRPGAPAAEVRKIILGTSPDIEHGTLSPRNPVLDLDDGIEQENHHASVFIYKNYYLMLYDYNLYMDYYGHGMKGNFVGDVRLAVSRDGEKFVRVNPHQSVIARGERNSWDSSFLVMAFAFEHEGRFHLYYSGKTENVSSWPSKNRIVGEGRSMAGYSYPAQSGLAILRKDGFTHLRARDGFGPGTVTTIPIRVKDPKAARLQLNVSDAMPYRDWVEVEVLNAATGLPVPGYGKGDCEDIVSEGTGITVTWKGAGDTLGRVEASDIKLRFYLYGKAKLHSFTFRNESGAKSR